MAIKGVADHAVQIDRLRLNISGLNKDEAEDLKRDVQILIQLYLPEQVTYRRLSALNLKVCLPEGTPRDRLAELIARQICECLP